MAMWQLAAARSMPMGSRSRNPRLLVRDSVQKSSLFVQRTSALGANMRPVVGNQARGASFSKKGARSRKYISPTTPISAKPATRNSTFQPTRRSARRMRPG